MVGQTISHYKILEKLGEGGMGVVYKALDQKLDRLVALKFLPQSAVPSPEEAARFKQEAKTISTLNHPNIATIYDMDEAGGQRFLVLEYLPGGTLKSKIKELSGTGRELPIEQVIQYALQMAKALAHAHQHGIIHRDIKTDNMMLSGDGEVKITDFGLAKLRGSVQLTKTGSTVGTAAYMSPEQVRGEEVDHRSDIFSLGVVLYELATGRLPFRGEHDAALSYSIVNENPIPVKSLRPNIPSSLENIIERCMEKARERRFQTAEEIIAELRRLQERVPGYGRRPSPQWVLAGAAVLLAFVLLYTFLPGKIPSADRKSIAVLPFKNLSDNKDDEYFSDGITEDIITQLSKIGDLKVISRTSVMQYKNSNKGLRDIAKDLGVAAVLEGSVRRAGGRVRIVSQLIDAQSDEHLWAETYDREMKDIFDIQSDVALKIALALKAKLSPALKERIEKKPTENLDAYSYYLKGREYYYRYHKQDNQNAIEFFKKALALDPNYALAYAGLGDAYGQGTQKFGFTDNWRDSTIAMSDKAVSLDPGLAEAYKALGLGYGEKGWLRKANAAARKSAELNPNYYPAVGNIGWGYWWIGQYPEALPWLKKSIALNPAFGYNYAGVGLVYLSLVDTSAAERWFRKALELQPDLSIGYIGLSLMYQTEGNFDQGLQQARTILSIAPDDFTGISLAGDGQLFLKNYVQAEHFYQRAIDINPAGRNYFSGKRNTTGLGYLYWKTGRQDEARRVFSQNLKLDLQELDGGSEWWAVPYDLAAVNAIQGKRADAYKWLQKAIDAGWGFYRSGQRDPFFENLHNDEQFQQMMARVKSKVDEMRKRAEEMEK